jgi:Skp family chaperone for outer membrane proteins
MKTFLAAGPVALWALTPAAASAQGATPAASSACYVEVATLLGEPPAGIGELGAAIRALDTKLRPQAEEINALKAEIARLEARQSESQSTPVAGQGPPDGFGDESPQTTPASGPDPTAEQIERAQAELEAKQNQLKLDYAEQQRVLVGPVQARVSERAQAFAAAQGCGELKMARAPDLAALATAGSRNVTGEFVTWYLANKS